MKERDNMLKSKSKKIVVGFVTFVMIMTSFCINSIETKAAENVDNFTIKTSVSGAGAISGNSEIKCNESASIFIIPAEGYSLTLLKVDGVSVTPVENYEFKGVENNHTVEAAFTMTQTRKMELLSKGYDWIDLKLD